jgi:hypothetical protein
MTSRVAIVILNWNGIQYLQKFLPSVTQFSDFPNTTVWIIDNGSTDESVSFVQKNFPAVKLVCLEKNFGFTGGYNLGLKAIDAEYYVILNSDVEVTRNWIDPIIKEFEKNPQLAAASPKLLSWHNREMFEYAGAAGGFIDHLGYPFCRGRVISHMEPDLGQYETPIPILWASGACMFVRAKVFHELGGFDDNFFAHMEEIDLCWRIKNAGYQIFNFPQSVVYHVGGGTLPNNNPRKIYLNFRNNLLLLYKNLPKKRLYYVLFLRFFLDLASATVFFLQRKFSFSTAVFKAYRDFISMRRKCKPDRSTVKWHPEIFSKSIVVGFFLLGRKKYSDYT